MTTFGQRLATALGEFGPLCVGIDPHDSVLRQWGLDATGDGVRTFGVGVVAAAAGRVGIVKPQVAFFERYGSAGYAALEEVLAAARSAGLLVIADAKRGDIGSTMDGYAAAWLTPDAPLEADAVTLSPYLGVGSLHATLTAALRVGRGVRARRDEQPEARPIQTAAVGDGAADDERVAEQVAREVGGYNLGSPGALGSIGVVVGATVDRAEFGLTETVLAGTPILAPGFGAQGAQPADLRRRFGYLASGVIANESRSILSAGPDGIAARIQQRAALYRESDA